MCLKFDGPMKISCFMVAYSYYMQRLNTHRYCSDCYSYHAHYCM